MARCAAAVWCGGCCNPTDFGCCDEKLFLTGFNERARGGGGGTQCQGGSFWVGSTEIILIAVQDLGLHLK